jgi:hypothetical protein
LRTLFAVLTAAMLATIAALLGTAGPAEAGSPASYLFDLGSVPAFQARPAAWAFHNPGVSYGFQRLTWAHWGAASATATGQFRTCANGASCSARSSAQLVATGLRFFDCGGRTRGIYTVLTIASETPTVVFRTLASDLVSTGCRAARGQTQKSAPAYSGFAAGSAGRSHSFYVGDAITLRFTAKQSNVLYRVCLKSVTGLTGSCVSRRTKASGHADVFSVAAPQTDGKFAVVWFVNGKAVATWSFSVGVGD